ncbi:FAD:protein FMN transferase [Pelagibius sp. CAU 1746]|uniref:FAD:protein FMN transferase n=1 Tax=Pelagibius sp. CAU 1746 TaxID=3140370 RepID=UPI00325A44B9
MPPVSNRSLSRRRFLAISAAAAALPAAARAARPVARWRGAALGAQASMTLVGVHDAEAGQVFGAVQEEIERMEGLFSLYRPDSLLTRLNAEGRLTAPPEEFLELLELSGRLQRATGGAFDPTIQPLWLLHATAAAENRRPAAGDLAQARARCGWQHLEISPGALRFTRPGMALTFNGIAQGYVADRVAALLRSFGLRDVLVDMGEIAARGRRPDGSPWRAGISLPGGRIVREVRLSERCLATSAPLGTFLDPAGRIGHILDPRSGEPGGRWRLVAVSAERAALADGLSTACCLLSREAIAAALAAQPGSSLEALH